MFQYRHKHFNYQYMTIIFNFILLCTFVRPVNSRNGQKLLFSSFLLCGIFFRRQYYLKQNYPYRQQNIKTYNNNKSYKKLNNSSEVGCMIVFEISSEIGFWQLWKKYSCKISWNWSLKKSSTNSRSIRLYATLCMPPCTLFLAGRKFKNVYNSRSIKDRQQKSRLLILED